MTSSPQRKSAVVDDYTIKYHANGKTLWSKGKIIDVQPDGMPGDEIRLVGTDPGEEEGAMPTKLPKTSNKKPLSGGEIALI